MFTQLPGLCIKMMITPFCSYKVRKLNVYWPLFTYMIVVFMQILTYCKFTS